MTPNTNRFEQHIRVEREGEGYLTRILANGQPVWFPVTSETHAEALAAAARFNKHTALPIVDRVAVGGDLR